MDSSSSTNRRADRYRQSRAIANLLKGAATGRLIADGIHPLGQYAKPDKRPHGMWARHQWVSFLDSDQAIENAINYVIENPIKEGKPKQNWKWITPYTGLDLGWTTLN